MKPLPGRMTAAAVLVCGLLAAGTGVAGLIVASHTGRGLLQPGRPAVIPAPAGPVSAPARGPATAVRPYHKDRLPTAAVYGPTPGAQLRLVTRGGVFDRGRRSYLSNAVVYAVAAHA